VPLLCIVITRSTPPSHCLSPCAATAVLFSWLQEFPADLILLASSNPAGICYDMTANLDGETNLKLHRVPVCTRDRAREPRGAWDLSATFKFELPNARIHNFNGSVMIDHVVHSLDTQHLMLRGAQLRNTDWIVGVVAYAGEDTKLSRNQQQPPSRMSVMEKRLNMYVIYMFILQVRCPRTAAFCYEFFCLVLFVWVRAWLLPRTHPLWADRVPLRSSFPSAAWPHCPWCGKQTMFQQHGTCMIASLTALLSFGCATMAPGSFCSRCTSLSRYL